MNNLVSRLPDSVTGDVAWIEGTSDIELLKEQIDDWRREAYAIRTRVLARQEAVLLSKDFASFVKAAWPILEPGRDLDWNWHIDYICAYLEAVAHGEIQRLVINVPPRCMKSLLVGVFWPAWRWTFQPHHQILSFSHNVSLSTRDAVKSRRLMNSQWYQDRWGSKFRFTTDANTKAAYENNQNGHRKAFGMSGGYMGDGGDTLVIDDPHDNEGAQSEAERETTLREFNDGVSTRLNSQRDGAIVIIMQRLHAQDIAGLVMSDEEDEWVNLCLPMEYDGVRYESPIGLDDPREETGELLWPSHIDLKGLGRLKRRLTPYGQAGQLQQRPTPPGGAILKDYWWRVWEKDRRMPECEYIIQVYDTAYESKEESDYSARTTWGVFRYNDQTRQEGEGRYNCILLERWKDRVLFPELKTEAKDSYDHWGPDTVLIEAKASGKPLIQELSRIGVPAQEWAVVRRGPKGKEVDKVARAHIASTMLYGGNVWYPEGRKWAQEVIEECAAFPKTSHDDLTDTVTMLLIWLRRLGYIELKNDPDDDVDDFIKHREAAYG